MPVIKIHDLNFVKQFFKERFDMLQQSLINLELGIQKLEDTSYAEDALEEQQKRQGFDGATQTRAR